MRTARSEASGTGIGSLKNTIIPSPEKWSSVPSDAATIGPSALWYSRSSSSTSSGSAVSEGGKPAQIAEHDDDVAAMGLKNVFVAARNDQFGELRREKPLQLSHPLQFSKLRRDPVLQLPVPRRDLLGARPQFAQEACVLYRDDSLSSEVLQESNLFVCERGGLFAENRDGT